MGLKQFGGEGKENYKGHKSDMTLKQYGGEGKNIGKVSGSLAFTPDGKPNPKYCGPGRYLKTESF